MKRARVLVVLALVACSSQPVDTPEVAAKKVQCRALLAHVFRISPQSGLAGEPAAAAQPAAEQMVAALPAEDIDQCVAADAKVIACMQGARDVAGVEQCVPAKSSGGE